MSHKLRRWWWRATHQTKRITYNPPIRIAGSYFTVGGMMTTSERRWYRITHRILWGQRARSPWW